MGELSLSAGLQEALRPSGEMTGEFSIDNGAEGSGESSAKKRELPKSRPDCSLRKLSNPSLFSEKS